CYNNCISLSLYSFTAPTTAEISTLSLHDALPILGSASPRKPRESIRSRSSRVSILLVAWRSRASSRSPAAMPDPSSASWNKWSRSEEHTSELQSRFDLVCRLLLEKKKEKQKNTIL